MVTGEDGNDTLTIVNPDGGLFAPMDGISYDGGGDPADALEILGGAANDLTYTAGATHDAGTLTYTGEAGTQTIAFAGIAPITDTVAAATLTIFGTGSNDAIAVTDGGLVNGLQTTQVSAPTFESIRFANKTTVTIIGNGGAADTLTFNNPTPAAGLSTLNVTNVGTVTQTGAVNYTNLSLNNVTGTVALTGSNDVTSLSALLTGAGNGFSFNDVDDVALTSVGFVNGVSTNNGAIAITTAVGPIIVANTAAGSDVNAGSSTVALTAGSFGATDFFIQLQPGANVTGLAGVQLRADNIDLTTGATVNAGSTTATLNAFTPATVIDLGGADTANTLGLTDAELDGITAGVLRIGDLTSGRIRFSDAITLGGIAQLEPHDRGGHSGQPFRARCHRGQPCNDRRHRHRHRILRPWHDRRRDRGADQYRGHQHLQYRWRPRRRRDRQLDRPARRHVRRSELFRRRHHHAPGHRRRRDRGRRQRPPAMCCCPPPARVPT